MALLGGSAFLLLVPLIAMQFSDEMTWDEADFILFGAMLALACGAIELAARVKGNILYRLAASVAALAAFLLVWVNLAVGFLGDEDNPANIMFLGVLGVAILGSLIARGEPAGMARAMVAAAVAQGLVGVIALAAGLGSAGTDGLYEAVLGTGLFATLWLISAWLFRKAGRQGLAASAS